MLKLEKLEVRGFKSFSDKTEIKFHEGITAVVGPNGCGKSNILDSIAWVLGEQSAKSLRGSKMEDVIFNGTGSRKPFSLAEVTLTLIATQDISSKVSEIEDIEIKDDISLENIGELPQKINDENNKEITEKVIYKRQQKKQIPSVTAGEKISVSRRLYRSGDSEYLMNGHTCRLRDIQDFFAGTGLSGAQYAIIEQGHIGQILSSKPQERRALIEEAAGITKFKAKKHLAELKLESTKQNMARLNDILAEIERQIAMLKKQAAKARRYKRLREQIRYYLKYIFINEYTRLNNQSSYIDQALSLLQGKEQKLITDFTSQDISYRSAQIELNKFTESLEQARVHYKDLQIESERTYSKIKHQQEQEQEVNIRIIESQQESQNIEEKKVINDKEILEKIKETQIISSENDDLKVKLFIQEKLYKDSQTSLIKLEKELEVLQTQLLTQVSKNEKAKHLQQQLLDSQNRTNRHKQHLNIELTKLEDQLSLFKSDYEQMRKTLSSSEDKLETFFAQLDDINEQLEKAKQSSFQAQKRLDELIRDNSRTEDRLHSLNQLNEKQAYFSESVQKLLGDKKIQKEFNLIGTLADILSVVPENEIIVERILGETLQTILVNNMEDAINAKNWLSKQKVSKVSFLLVENKDVNSANVKRNVLVDNKYQELLGLLGLRGDRVDLFKQTFPNLSGALVVEDIILALKVSKDNPDVMVFTHIGEQVKAGKLLTTAGGISSNANVLQLKREIKELNDKLIGIQEEQEKANSYSVSQKEKVLQLEQHKKEIDTLIRSEEKSLVARRVELSQAAKEVERTQQQLKTVTLQDEQAAKEMVNIIAKLKTTIEEVEITGQSRQEIEQQLEQKKLEIAKQKPSVEIANQEFSRLLSINAAQEERKKAFDQALTKLEDEKQQLIKRGERISSELIQLKERSQELKNNLAVAEKIIGSLEKETSLAKKNVEKAETTLVSIREKNTKQEESINILRSQITEVKEEKSVIQIEKTRVETELQHLEQSCFNELSEHITELVATDSLVSKGLEDQFVVNDVASAQQLLTETRAKLSDLGPVNMMALEELTETEQRQAFLQQQYKDILVSINSTEEALREIKIRSRIKFREAFQKINQNFSEMFQELFGGGRGEMLLINEEDVLESGIDINAQPPGKKLQNILLLSGGEKAMTALALVLGIFRFRPSPFCVLDEVDAPLDDMNIGRFAEKIRQMSEQTQFLVITHSKRTMEMASSIYGVTMQEPGVSKLISVRLG